MLVNVVVNRSLAARKRENETTPAPKHKQKTAGESRTTAHNSIPRKTDCEVVQWALRSNARKGQRKLYLLFIEASLLGGRIDTSSKKQKCFLLNFFLIKGEDVHPLGVLFCQA